MEIGEIIRVDSSLGKYPSYNMYTIHLDDGKRLQLNDDEIVKMNEDVLKAGDIIFFDKINNKLSAITVNFMKSKYGEFLNITENLKGNESLQIDIEPGTATPKQIGEFLGELSLLYEMMGGSGLTFSQNNINVLINN